jgi:hypothetical protein
MAETPTIPVERAYAFAQALMLSIPTNQWLNVAKATLQGQVDDWAGSYAEELRRHLADRIVFGEPAIRLAVETMAQDAYRGDLEKALESVLRRIRRLSAKASIAGGHITA